MLVLDEQTRGRYEVDLRCCLDDLSELCSKTITRKRDSCVHSVCDLRACRRYTPRQIALLPGDAKHLVVVEADHNEFNQTEAEVSTAPLVRLRYRSHPRFL